MASEDKLRALQSLAHHLADRFHAHRDEVVAAYELELRRVREAAQRAADAAAQILREAADGGAGGVALPVRFAAAASALSPCSPRTPACI